MAKIKVIHDIIGETLTIYFKEPTNNTVCEETEHEIIFIKDEKTNEVIGFEKLHFKIGEENLTIEKV